jgi:membrane protein implicated in regulation of membrane protease activity
MLVPGVYLIWLGMAAIITGILTMGLDLSPAIQLIDFVFLSLIMPSQRSACSASGRSKARTR